MILPPASKSFIPRIQSWMAWRTFGVPQTAGQLGSNHRGDSTYDFAESADFRQILLWKPRGKLELAGEQPDIVGWCGLNPQKMVIEFPSLVDSIRIHMESVWKQGTSESNGSSSRHPLEVYHSFGHLQISVLWFIPNIPIEINETPVESIKAN